jgi:hypothetical protein
MLNRVTSHLYNLNWVRKAVFYSSPALILTLWKAADTSIFVNHFAFAILLKVSWISGNGYWSFLVIALRAL